MATKFRVIGWSAGTGTEVGEFDNAIDLAMAMWNLGLDRPNFDSISVSEIPVMPFLDNIAKKYKVSTEDVNTVLDREGGSIIHAGASMRLKRQADSAYIQHLMKTFMCSKDEAIEALRLADDSIIEASSILSRNLR